MSGEGFAFFRWATWLCDCHVHGPMDIYHKYYMLGMWRNTPGERQ